MVMRLVSACASKRDASAIHGPLEMYNIGPVPQRQSSAVSNCLVDLEGQSRSRDGSTELLHPMKATPLQHSHHSCDSIHILPSSSHRRTSPVPPPPAEMRQENRAGLRSRHRCISCR